MAQQSDVVVVHVLMENELKKSDMIDFITEMQKYLGWYYPIHCRLLSGGDQLTCKTNWLIYVIEWMETQYKNIYAFLNLL